MEYVTFVTLVDFEAQRNRAFAFPLQTACGLFKLTIRKKGLTLVAAVELSAPTYNGSEQFPWILPGVTIQLRLLNAPGHHYSGNWTFSTTSRTWITEYMSCAELYKRTTASPPTPTPPVVATATVSHNKMVRPPHRRLTPRRAENRPNRHAVYVINPQHADNTFGLLSNPINCPPTIEVRMHLAEPSLQIFSMSHDAFIHTSATYANIHRSLHCLLLSNLFLNSQAPNKEVQHIIREFALASNPPSLFPCFVESLVRAESRILSEDFANTFRFIVSQLIPDVDEELRLVDWEGDPGTLLDICESVSRNVNCVKSSCQPRVLILRLNSESGFLKTLMRRIAIDIPLEIELAGGDRYNCVGAFLSMSRHELSMLRSTHDGEWLRVTDHGYSACVIREHITCHKRLLPSCLIYSLAQDDSPATPFAIRCANLRFDQAKPLSCGTTSAGGLALTSTHYIASSEPQFELTSRIRAPCVQAYYGVIPWQSRTPEDLNALEQILKLLEGASVVSEDGNGSGSTSASSDISRSDRSVSWFRLASLYYKHIGYSGILWADTLIHNSDSCPTLWPLGVTERLFKTRVGETTSVDPLVNSDSNGESRQQVLKRKSRIRISMVDFTKLLPAGKRRRIPHGEEKRNSNSDTPPTCENVGLSPRGTNFGEFFQSSESWFAIRLILSNILHSIFDNRDIATSAKSGSSIWPPKISTTALSPVRLTFEFDPNYAYDLLLPRESTSLEFQAGVLRSLRECQNLFPSWSAWTGWFGFDNGCFTLWRRHGTTWRQILANARLRSQIEYDVDAQEVLFMFHPPNTQPGLTETVLDVLYLDQFTFEPVHVGFVTSLSLLTVEDLYVTKIRPRLSIHAPSVDAPPKVMPNAFSCTATDGTLVLETLPIKKLRMTQGALTFSVTIPVNTRPTRKIGFNRAPSRRKKRVFFNKGTEDSKVAVKPQIEPPPQQPPGDSFNLRRRDQLKKVKISTAAASAVSGRNSAEIRLFECLWTDFAKGGQGISLTILADLMRKYKARAARYIDSIRVIDSRVCQLMAICGEALLPSMARTRSSSRRMAQSLRGSDCTIAQTLVTKLQNCLLTAAGNYDHDLCLQCIDALHVVDLDLHNNDR